MTEMQSDELEAVQSRAFISFESEHFRYHYEIVCINMQRASIALCNIFMKLFIP